MRIFFRHRRRRSRNIILLSAYVITVYTRYVTHVVVCPAVNLPTRESRICHFSIFTFPTYETVYHNFVSTLYVNGQTNAQKSKEKKNNHKWRLGQPFTPYTHILIPNLNSTRIMIFLFLFVVHLSLFTE